MRLRSRVPESRRCGTLRPAYFMVLHLIASEMGRRYNAEGMHFPVFIDRHIFSRDKMLVRKMVTHVVSAAAGNIVLEGPSSARPMDQMAKIVVLAGAEACNPASLAVRVSGLSTPANFHRRLTCI